MDVTVMMVESNQPLSYSSRRRHHVNADPRQCLPLLRQFITAPRAQRWELKVWRDYCDVVRPKIRLRIH